MTASPPGGAGIVGSMLPVEPVHPLIVADLVQDVRHRDRFVPSVGELPGEQLTLEGQICRHESYGLALGLVLKVALSR
jgi:hypothetical protein